MTQFVSELVSADGELKDNAAGNYVLRYERSPVFLTSHTSRLFLGLPMQCAECHDHKTETWLQKDFYGVAAFFTGIQSEEKGMIKGMDMIGNEKEMENYLITNNTKQDRAMYVESMKESVTPRFLDGTDYKGELIKKRKALAEWMTARENPFFSKAIVNRIWKTLYGTRIR